MKRRAVCRSVPLIAAVCLAGSSAVRYQPLQVPFFRQEKNGCGAASVAMVMHYWGKRQPPDEVYRKLYDAELHGIPLAAMKQYLEEAGMRAFTLQGEWADVQEHLGKGRPIIVGLKKHRQKPMHFAVIVGAESDRLWLNDPTRTKAMGVTRADFLKQWKQAGQWMLLASPLPPN